MKTFKNLSLLAVFLIGVNLSSYSQRIYYPPKNQTPYQKYIMNVQYKAEKHLKKFALNNKWGKTKIRIRQWEKGSYEIWFYTRSGVVGKMHYYKNGTFKMFENRNWMYRFPNERFVV